MWPRGSGLFISYLSFVFYSSWALAYLAASFPSCPPLPIPVQPQP